MGLFLRGSASPGDEIAFIPRELVLGFGEGDTGPGTCNAIEALFSELAATDGNISPFWPYLRMKAVQLGHDNTHYRVPSQWSEETQNEMQGLANIGDIRAQLLDLCGIHDTMELVPESMMELFQTRKALEFLVPLWDLARHSAASQNLLHYPGMREGRHGLTLVLSAHVPKGGELFTNWFLGREEMTALEAWNTLGSIPSPPRSWSFNIDGDEIKFRELATGAVTMNPEDRMDGDTPLDFWWRSWSALGRARENFPTTVEHDEEMLLRWQKETFGNELTMEDNDLIQCVNDRCDARVHPQNTHKRSHTHTHAHTHTHT
jgi:hypothetical protein